MSDQRMTRYWLTITCSVTVDAPSEKAAREYALRQLTAGALVPVSVDVEHTENDNEDGEET